MQYDEIQYVPEDQDPSLTIETRNLVAKVIDNSGLSLAINNDTKSNFSKYGTNGRALKKRPGTCAIHKVLGKKKPAVW